MKIKHILLISTILLLSGCVQFEEDPLVGQVVYTVDAEMQNDVTKTSVTDDGYLTWSKGDQIWLHSTGGGVLGSLATGAGTPNATFTYGAYFGEMTGRAVYPYNQHHSISGDKLTVMLPSEYNLDALTGNTNALMYATTKDNVLRFSHMAGVMRFILRDAPVGATQFKITLDKKINGAFKADLSEDYPVVTATDALEDSEKTITINFKPLKKSKTLRIYVPLPTGTYNSLAIELNGPTQNLWSYSKAVTNTIKRKSLVLMPEVSMEGIAGEEPASVDLSELGTANSYIVSEAGNYRFKAVKGNSSESVGSIASVEVLWESFGTDVTPEVRELVDTTWVSDDYVKFTTSESFKEGNAVIAAKDENGSTLWSWHIWLTDQPKGQVYYRNAGTMMDRNLGATSCVPGDKGTSGLYYQWGRKDPFLSSSSKSANTEAKSTIVWPSPTASSSETGTIEYAVANPTTYITYNRNNWDWYYTESNSTDDSRWQLQKTIYDPCPVGWRVPEGSKYGVWSTAVGEDFSYRTIKTDEINKGINMSGLFGADETIWYPFSGNRSDSNASIQEVGRVGTYWTVSTNYQYAYYLYIYSEGTYYNNNIVQGANTRSLAMAIRCQKDGSSHEGYGNLGDDHGIDVSIAEDLSVNGTANSYVVTHAGTYSIATTIGNSSEAITSIDSASILWESFGTTEKPDECALIQGVLYKDNKLYFKTSDVYRHGNALIAVKDSFGKILWSWHIWMTDQPREQTYYNAGIMMDRNLGAVSAEPGDDGGIGLQYQWGRKDPFLYTSKQKSTGVWLSVESDMSKGTIEYATANPTTLISLNGNNYDWHYSLDESIDDTRWQSAKTIYDPCPPGWRVSDGGKGGVWAIASGKSAYFSATYDSSNRGINFSGVFGDDLMIWYPYSAKCWSCTTSDNRAYYFDINSYGTVYPVNLNRLVDAYSVRCYKEDSINADLSQNGTANSYVVSMPGNYSFSAVKGNSTEQINNISSVEVLWESYGTDEAIAAGSLISSVSYSNGKIMFSSAKLYREGNAVIAARNGSGEILWSWHIWFTDPPEQQIYYNNAGTLMDRNLGATSAEIGDVGALGLLYQWGRKDPFLGSADIDGSSYASSTIVWPSAVVADSSTGNIEFAIANPTTFITCDYYHNDDWCYSEDQTNDDTRWASVKTIYDPCPPGWRVPEGGDDNVWAKAAGMTGSNYQFRGSYDSTNKGMKLNGKVSDSYPLWYPSSGTRSSHNGRLQSVGFYGYYWSSSVYTTRATRMDFSDSGYVYPRTYDYRSSGNSVRCSLE